VEKSGGVGIALSGGLDARSILALVDQSNDPITAICYSMRGSLDHRCSEHMSRIAGNPYHHYELGTEFLSEYRRHLEQMVLLTDGQYLSQCIVMPTLPLYEQHGIEVLLRGHAGEMMHMHKAYAYTLDDEALNAKTDGEIESWLMSHLQAYMLDSVDGPLLMPQFQSALEQEPREALKRELRECSPASPPVQTVWELFISARLRRETSLSMAKFSSTVDIRLPYLDNDLIDLLLMAPPDLKMGDTIQGHILRTRRPEFLDVINANTGAKIGAPKMVQQFSSLKKRVLGKLGVPGYQPYERLGLWLRREIAPTVHEVLLTDQCKSRGIFQPDALERVVNNHMAGKANSTYLLMALMIIELGQRYLNGEEGFAAHSV
jgi:asparagine synthase (glutamine-hydrolysing)